MKGKRIYGANIKIDLDVCTYCGDPIDDYSRTVDHLIPESRGGILAKKNKVPCCKDCNKLKDNMTPEEFVQHLERFVRMLQSAHRKQVDRLKKIRLNTQKIIDSKDGRPAVSRNSNGLQRKGD